jgi:hypothetical protein
LVIIFLQIIIALLVGEMMIAKTRRLCRAADAFVVEHPVDIERPTFALYQPLSPELLTEAHAR